MNYKIIDTSILEARIAELENFVYPINQTLKQKECIQLSINRELNILKEILQQAQDLQPVLENAFNKGQDMAFLPMNTSNSRKEEFIKNFKL